MRASMAMSMGAGKPVNLIRGLAALGLSFIDGSPIDPRITFTRATTRTYFNSSGVLSTAAINTPAIDYDPVTLACRGLSIWEARTNLALRSEEFDNAAWTSANVTVAANNTTAPDGSATADRLTATAVDSLLYQNIVVVNATAYKYTVWLRADTNTTLTLFFFDGAFATLGSTVANVTTTWQRFTVTGTANSVSGKIAIGGGSTFSTGEIVYAWGAQLEAGSSASPYIPTTTAQVTRAADVAVISGANFSNFYNQTEGTFVVDANYGAGVSVFQVVFSATDNTSSNVMYAYRNTSSGYGANVDTGGANQAALALGTSAAAVNAKVALGYKVNDFVSSKDGAVAVTDVSGTVPTVTQLRLGIRESTALPLNGHIRSITYYPVKFANATYPTLST